MSPKRHEHQHWVSALTCMVLLLSGGGLAAQGRPPSRGQPPARSEAGAAQAGLELRGRVVLGDSSPVPAGTTIERLHASGVPTRMRQELGADGTFVFRGVPASEPSLFRVRVPRSGAPRSVVPSSIEFTFSPPPTLTGGTAEVTWQVPTYRWLVVKTGPRLRSRLEEGRAPYPVFLLQRWEAGQWRVHPAEEFARGQGQVAISLLQPGTYRVIAALSPQEVHESDPVVVGEADRQAQVSFQDVVPGRPCELRVYSHSQRRPLAGVQLALVGPHASLPPVRVLTDAQGRFRLEGVRTQALHVELEHEGSEPLTKDIARECLETGTAELTVR